MGGAIGGAGGWHGAAGGDGVADYERMGKDAL